jgi:hypothetical protein
MSARSDRYLPDSWQLPELDAANRPLFTTGRLVLQQCASCRGVQHPPLDVCIECQSFEFDYIEVRESGVVESYTIVHHAASEALLDRVPYNVVVVALDDHPHVRLVGNVIDCDNADITIGMRVSATWAPVTDGAGQTIYLPQWRLS